jgi:hypothetical protein
VLSSRTPQFDKGVTSGGGEPCISSGILSASQISGGSQMSER